MGNGGGRTVRNHWLGFTCCRIPLSWSARNLRENGPSIQPMQATSLSRESQNSGGLSEGVIKGANIRLTLHRTGSTPVIVNMRNTLTEYRAYTVGLYYSNHTAYIRKAGSRMPWEC